jgi:hypothetical protein
LQIRIIEGAEVYPMGFDPNKKSGTAWEQRLHEAGARIEEDLRWLIAHVNDEVVPEVRRNGSAALRAAAEQMEKLAQKMDAGSAGGSGSAKGEGKR